jgi:hypothetical protein
MGLGGGEALIGLLPLLLVVYALYDILTNDFRDSNMKLIWVLVVILVPCLGSILYLTIGQNQKIKKNDRY